jgi:hypothetical protein
MPILEVDQDGSDLSDRLFNIDKAKFYIMTAVQDYIDHNYKDCCVVIIVLIINDQINHQAF